MWEEVKAAFIVLVVTIGFNLKDSVLLGPFKFVLVLLVLHAEGHVDLKDNARFACNRANGAHLDSQALMVMCW